ncbi:putative Ferritin-like superfamily [Helianthus annuus]|nr:putative Ferritin-like superfamily [Helianthus annuus]
MTGGETLVEGALRVLNTPDPVEKAKLGDQIANNWLQGLILDSYTPSQPDFMVPDRPARLTNVSFQHCSNITQFCLLVLFFHGCTPSVKLVSPSLMPKLGKAGSLQSRQAIVHSLVHTESWAIDLSWDIIARFGKQESMPREFFDDFVRVAQDEGRHFTLLAARLEELGSHYGALPAHDGLWDSAVATSKDLFARLAVEHCVHEARGLDVLPTTISRFRNGGDNQTAELLEKVIYPEEITHCAAGVKWFKYLCSRSCGGEESDVEVINKFHEVVRSHFRGPLKPPFNESARRAAGFGPQWYEPLAVKDFTQ